MHVASHFATKEEIKENNYYRSENIYFKKHFKNGTKTSLYVYRDAETTTVPVIRIADFINNVVATRALPENKSGVVVMKLDVEVTEMEDFDY